MVWRSLDTLVLSLNQSETRFHYNQLPETKIKTRHFSKRHVLVNLLGQESLVSISYLTLFLYFYTTTLVEEGLFGHSTQSVTFFNFRVFTH